MTIDTYALAWAYMLALLLKPLALFTFLAFVVCGLANLIVSVPPSDGEDN